MIPLNIQKIIAAVILIAIFLILSWQIIALQKKLEAGGDSYDQLKHQSDSIIAQRQLEIDSLETEYLNFVIKRDSLTKAIAVINNKYNQIKTGYEQKKDSVSGLNLNGLHDFFSGELSPGNNHQ